MPYGIHIRRVAPSGETSPISIEEWRAAVEKTEGVRLAKGPLTAVNPVTGEPVSIGNSGGDAEVFLPDANEWFRVFRWSPRGVHFAARSSFADMPFCGIVLELAHRLGASVIGDEGEKYG
jgi:hypothetical protein